MTQRRWIWGLLLVGVLTGASIAVAAPKLGSTIYVRTMSAKVMKAPKFIGATAGSVARGDSLQMAEAKGDWYRVTGGATGWIHKSNVSETNVALSSASGGSAGASQQEVELAGRGFTPEVERDYKTAHPELDFSHIDAIEKTSVDVDSLQAFVDEGGLGGAQ